MQEKILGDRRSSDASASPFLDTHYERRGDPFDVIEADSPALKEIFYRLRYRVYCEELRPDARLDEAPIECKEQDAADVHSLHFLMIYKPLNMFFGGMRVVLPLKDKPFCALPAFELDTSPFHETPPSPPETAAEFSRFLISKELSKIIRNVDGEKGKSPENSPHNIIRLVKVMVQRCMDHNIQTLCGITSLSLLRAIKMINIPYHTCGTPIHYHGKRQPFYINIEEAKENFKLNDIKTYNFLFNNVQKEHQK